MARLGQPAEDLSDDELRARAIKLVRREQGALEAVAKALAMDDPTRPRRGRARRATEAARLAERLTFV
jgi:hypothetical protein